MRSPAVLLVLLLLVQPCIPSTMSVDGTPSVVLAAVHPGGNGDWEHVIVKNAGQCPVDLAGWCLSDGEGTWTVPNGTMLRPGQRVSIGTNTTAFQVLWGEPLDAMAEASGAFCLADRGDGLLLASPGGQVADQLAYGETGEVPRGWQGEPVPTPSSIPWGRLLVRSPRDDTDTAADWSGWTEPRCGWMEPLAPSVPSLANVSCFVTPGGGWDALTGAIDGAGRTLDIALYDITSLDLAAAVAEASRRGVRTRLLVEGSPVGKGEDGRAWRSGLLEALSREGVTVWETLPNVKGESHRPYRYHHEKYCVVDGERVVVTTENWCAGSFPVEGSSEHASRGWGAVVESRRVAEDLLRVLENDVRLSACRMEAGGVKPLELPFHRRPGGVQVARPGEATVLLGPEGWGPDLDDLLAPIRGAEASILLELAYLDLWWGGRVSPMVEALLAAASRGVEVRMVLDGGVGGEGQAALVDLLELAHRRGVTDVRGVVAADIPGIDRVHTKGAVIDGRVAVLGSLNWAWSSVARNREVVVVVEGEQAVRPLARALEEDWNASVGVAAPTPPRSLVMEAVQRWEGRTFPRVDLEPFDTGGGVQGADVTAGPTPRSVARAALVVALFLTLWYLDHRYAYTVRAKVWLRGRVRRLRRRLEAPSPRPSPGGEAPCAPRTSCPARDPGTGGPPGGPPPAPPPDRAPRVVVLEEVP